MKYQILHNTGYQYTEPVSICHNMAHLLPRDYPRQSWLYHELVIDPAPAVQTRRYDYFGNPVLYFAIQKSHESLAVTARGLVDVIPAAPPESMPEMPWQAITDMLHQRRGQLAEPFGFTLPSPAIPLTADLLAFARESFHPENTLLRAARDLMRRIYEQFTFDTTSTTISTPLDQVLEKRHGVCQDFAHLAIGCFRSFGLAARYVSGYLLTIPPPGQAKIVGADASHAWVSTFLPGYGWVDLDPTNNLFVCDQHIAIAYGRDFHDISPLRGVVLGGHGHTVNVSVDVEAVPDEPASSASGAA